ncbi:MAG: Rpn family recombination-promoting nuclease/putative transposase [Clostridiales bacterium]|jgi:hypothetical protein|nr:Rpn family recombination-promoting nuclease/putative transposase [Clostridiales bacterium]
MRKLKYTFKSDILFKMTFVKYKHLLKCLVAAVLKITFEEIEEFVIINSEIVPEALNKKFCRLDIHLKVNGQYVNIEMQVASRGNFAERLLVYWSKVFSSALGSGEDYAVVPKAILISFIDFDLFDCEEYCSEFVCSEFSPQKTRRKRGFAAPLFVGFFMEKYRYELLTDKMSIFVFELNKLPEEIDITNILELFLRLFKADTEEELETLAKLEVDEVTQMIKAYQDIVNSPDYADLERQRLMAAMDENQAINSAERRGEERGEERERAKWQGEHAKLQGEHAELQGKYAETQAEIARLRAQLGLIPE